MAPCLKNVQFGDFPSGPGVKNLPCNAGDMASIPDQGTKNPPAAEQLSQGATTIEPIKNHIVFNVQFHRGFEVYM